MDTDGDGLSDGDEKVIGTNPKKQDTDGDGIRDGEEIFKQEIQETCYEAGLLEESEAVLASLVVSTKGNANADVKVSEYTDYLKNDKNYYIGKTIEITGTEMNTGTISFQLIEDYEIKEYIIGGISTNGLLICYNDGENTIPLETEFDEVTRTLKANITAEGNYFVLDALSWMKDMGFNLSTGRQALFSLAAVEEEVIKNQERVIFVVDTTASMAQYLSRIKAELTDFSMLLEEYADVKFALVEYKDIEQDGNSSTKLCCSGEATWLSA